MNDVIQYEPVDVGIGLGVSPEKGKVWFNKSITVPETYCLEFRVRPNGEYCIEGEKDVVLHLTPQFLLRFREVLNKCNLKPLPLKCYIVTHGDGSTSEIGAVSVIEKKGGEYNMR